MSKQNQVGKPQENDAALTARRRELKKAVIATSIVQFVGICLIIAFMPVRVDGNLQFSYQLWQGKSGSTATEIFVAEILILYTLTNIPVVLTVLKHRRKSW